MDYVIYNEFDIREFKFWSGAENTIKAVAYRGQLDELQDLIEEVFIDHTPDETEINDFVWFETDFIAENFSYKNWEEYCDITNK